MSDSANIDAVLDQVRETIRQHISQSPHWFGQIDLTIHAKDGVLTLGETARLVDTCKPRNQSQPPRRRALRQPAL